MSRRLVAITVASLALGACGTQSATSALTDWTTSSNLAGALSQLTLDARHVLSALEDPASSGVQLHTVCAVLYLETLQANSSLPTPDAQTTALLSGAYTDLGAAANQCYVAGASPSKRRRAMGYLHAAGAKLSEAQARVSAVTAAG